MDERLDAATHQAITARLFEWLAIPSVSADPAHAADVGRSAEWVAHTCSEVGFSEVEILETDGHPAVLARWCGAGPSAPTVLVYGHHDVQPVEPLHEWATPPFEPTLVEGDCLARGAIDDKGQVLYHLEAVRRLLADGGTLPVNLIMLVEGEEEVGSPHFEELLRTQRDRLACDVVVVSDTGMIAEDVPSTDVAMRGLVACTITLTTSSTDLHSGMFGGAVPNALHHLVRLLDGLHDDDLNVAIDGFADEVRPLSVIEQASLAEQPFDEDEFRRLAGVEFLEGETGRSTLERIGARPTAEIVGITGGHSDVGIKTIVPATATAKVTFRLVPDQDPHRIMELVESWVASSVVDGVEVDLEWHGGVAPARTSTDTWAFAALSTTIEQVWGQAPLCTRVGGSGPEETLGRVLDSPVIFLGVGLPGDRIHAPNERMVMNQFWRGLRAAGVLYEQLAHGYEENG